MQHPLWLLTKLKFNASWRKLFRSAKTLRGALLLFFAIGFISLMVVPQFFVPKGQLPMGDFVQRYGPLVLLAYTLVLLVTSVGDYAITFSPSEVDMLFPAPLSRKTLLAYKLINNVASSIFMSLIIGVTNRHQFHYWFAGIIGVLLTFSFLQLLGILVSFIGQSLTGRTYTRGRRIVAISVLAAMAFAFSQAITQWDGNFLQIPSLIESTMVGKVLLAPFRLFCNMMTAERIFPEFLGYATATIAMIAGLVVCIFRLDTDFSDMAIRVSKMRYERKKAMQRGQVMAGAKNIRSTRIPMFPFLSGSGPLVWRQVVRTVRVSKTMVRVLFVVALALGIPLYINLSKQSQTHAVIPYIVWGALIYVSTLMTGALPIGFRIDLERLEVFKSQPISPWAVTVGQLIGPTIFVTAVYWFLFAILTVLLPHFWLQWVIGAVVSIPLNFVVLCASSSLFLTFPVSLEAAGQDFQTGMKNMLMFMLNFLIVGVSLGLVGAITGLVFFLSRSEVLAAVVAFVLLAAEGVIGVMAVRTAFIRFDVTKHMPN